MKLSTIVENVILIFFFLAVIAFPWVANYAGLENNLSGAEEKVELRFDTLDDYITQNFPGREILVRTKNQLLYSLFDVSPNSSITKVGDNLLATESLNYYFHGLHYTTKKEVQDLVEKLDKFNAICDKKGKKLVVIVTPNKPRYVKSDALPFADDVILAYQKDFGEKPYDMFMNEIKKTKIKFFDCIDYIDNHKDTILEGKVPLFYNSGHHWSNVKGNFVGLALIDYMKKSLHIKMPTMKVYATPSDAAVYPDSDLFDVLNIYDKPNEKFYKPVIKYLDYDNDNLTYTIQGGSFLGGLLFPNSTISMEGKVIHIENKACIYDNYRSHVMFESYDDLNKKINLLEHLKNTNVFCLEINELNVYNATFGFLDYLIEHEEDI